MARSVRVRGVAREFARLLWVLVFAFAEGGSGRERARVSRRVGFGAHLARPRLSAWRGGVAGSGWFITFREDREESAGKVTMGRK